MTQVQTIKRKDTLRNKLNNATTKFAVVATPVIMATGAHAADGNSVDVSSLALTGLGAAAASVFVIKAGPSLLMWGYRKVLGFVGR
ncbi:hypothetical protein [Acinetobacter pollinis]|uniref:hypothetical protein n=1 Tax=Acinetobacter pollinis TaxID=2605270 RepID=UPI0018A2963F|nr:hypothetical protein [Acinetobacter pollinis]MBF7691717.1 hypothetical protein [Acinetobacter pollinis]MBF7691727.1 hypothetical protein [Acinetobacter pollinis]MBF7699335.1 hypothetical protein [Acinetobacter pollinis]MBF7699342.1 hypothetical protein [Acinetobacter pollinis]